MQQGYVLFILSINNSQLTMSSLTITPFAQKTSSSLTKDKITVLQINLGRKCNLACTHCHVEASPKRTEELSAETCQQLIEVINRFSQIKTVDLTGGAPEMNYGFKSLVKASRAKGKEVIVRSNLTIFFEPGYEDLPEYFAQNQLRVIASLPCYLEANVDKQRGTGVYFNSIQAIKKLNHLGYGEEPNLIIDLVYNPALPIDDKTYLWDKFGLHFNSLFTIANLPIGRTKQYLDRKKLGDRYLHFLEQNYNQLTLPHLMCRNQLSIDYLGNVYDCDFNQMENIVATTAENEPLTVAKILALKNLDVIKTIKTANYCYGCTAGTGSSCGGALID